MENLLIPSTAFIIHPGPFDPGQPIMIVRVKAGAVGYWWAGECDSIPQAQALADELNGGPLDPRVAEACLVGSMFGWGVPGANPNIYDLKDGRAVPKKA